MISGEAERFQLIVNPQAAGGRAGRVAEDAAEALRCRGVEVVLRETTGPGVATDMALAAAREGFAAVIALGGDGTVHEVAEGLMRAGTSADGRPALGVVPAGTGNDFVKALGIDRDIRAALDAIAAGEARPFDIGSARWAGGEETFVNAVGTGIDVEVVRQLEKLPRMPGVASYVVALVRALGKYRAVPLTIELDGDALERRVMIIAVANGRCIGGGFHVCPRARPDDGLLDVCVVEEVGLLGIARIMPRIMRGTHTEMERVSLHRAKTVRITAAGDEDLFFQLDGELREPAGARELSVRVLPGALRVFAPPREQG
ncbi:MAG: diacylglycerol kinase family protein [Gemmatimonadota bacterium]